MPYQILIDALLLVHSGGRFLPPPVAKALESRMPDGDLRPREQEVLQLLVNGKSNKEIASELGITNATVKCHASTILMRLNMSDRTQAVVATLQRVGSSIGGATRCLKTVLRSAVPYTLAAPLFRNPLARSRCRPAHDSVVAGASRSGRTHPLPASFQTDCVC